MGVFSKALGRFDFISSKAFQKFSPKFPALEQLRPRQLRPRLLRPRLLRPQDFQEQQALANAQIMTFISFLADTFIQSDLKEDQEEHNGIQIEGHD
jgi:hypothetical protein